MFEQIKNNVKENRENFKSKADDVLARMDALIEDAKNGKIGLEEFEAKYNALQEECRNIEADYFNNAMAI